MDSVEDFLRVGVRNGLASIEARANIARLADWSGIDASLLEAWATGDAEPSLAMIGHYQSALRSMESFATDLLAEIRHGQMAYWAMEDEEKRAKRAAKGGPLVRGASLSTVRGRDVVRNIPPAVRMMVLARYDEVCQACNAKYSRVIDHVIPLSRGGDNDASNLQVLCRECNSSKSNFTMSEWLASKDSAVHA